MRVENILSTASKRLVIVREGAPLVEAAKLLLEADADLLVVCNAARRMAGVISKTDVVRQIGRRSDGEGMPVVSALMTRTVVSCKPGDQLHDVWTTMKDRRLKNLPVLDQDSRLIGMVSARDLLEALLEEVEHEEVLLRDYVMSIGHPGV